MKFNYIDNMLSKNERAKVAEYRLLMANVYEMAAVSRRESDAIAASRSVTATQWHTMSVVSGQDASVPQIAARLGVTRQAAQRVADQLVDSGHLDRVPNPRHHTSPLMHLTPRGKRILDELWDLSDESRADLLTDIDTRRLEQAAQTLRDILDAFRT